MRSLEPLVHGANVTAPPFNATFFATAATIIPVFFLALAVQGRGFEHILRAATTEPDQAAALKLRNPLLLFPPRLLLTAAFVIVTAGVVGEGGAMTVLYEGHASSADGITVLVSTLILLLAVVTGPLLAFQMVLAGKTAARIRSAADRRDESTSSASSVPVLPEDEKTQKPMRDGESCNGSSDSMTRELPQVTKQAVIEPGLQVDLPQAP
jgi:hypothetical protein